MPCLWWVLKLLSNNRSQLKIQRKVQHTLSHRWWTLRGALLPVANNFVVMGKEHCKFVCSGLSLYRHANTHLSKPKRRRVSLSEGLTVWSTGAGKLLCRAYYTHTHTGSCCSKLLKQWFLLTKCSFWVWIVLYVLNISSGVEAAGSSEWAADLFAPGAGTSYILETAVALV